MPKNLETIFEYDNEAGKRSTLAVDAEGHLFWNGKPVVVERSITLTAWQKIGATITIVSAAMVGLTAAAQLWTAIAPE
jgi:hypothetical protein